MRSAAVIVLSAIAASLVFPSNTNALPITKRHDGATAVSGTAGPSRGGSIYLNDKKPGSDDALVSVLDNLVLLSSKNVKAGSGGVSQTGNAYGGNGGSINHRDLNLLGSGLGQTGSILRILPQQDSLSSTDLPLLSSSDSDHLGNDILGSPSLANIQTDVNDLLGHDGKLLSVLDNTKVLNDESYTAGDGGFSSTGDAYGGNGGSGNGNIAGGNGGPGYSGAAQDVSGGNIFARSTSVDCANQILDGTQPDADCIESVDKKLESLADNETRRSWLQQVVSGQVNAKRSQPIVTDVKSTVDAVAKGFLKVESRALTANVDSTTQCFVDLAAQILATSSNDVLHLGLYASCSSELTATLATLPDNTARKEYLIKLAGTRV